MGNVSQITLVERYFEAVDGQRLEDILALMAPDCSFSVKTHGVSLRGKAEISAMFHRLWSNHKAVRHHGFAHINDAQAGRISSQFQVANTEFDGSVTRKSNCNFFDVKDGVFTAVAVYMAGPNTLNT